MEEPTFTLSVTFGVTFVAILFAYAQQKGLGLFELNFLLYRRSLVTELTVHILSAMQRLKLFDCSKINFICLSFCKMICLF